MQMPLCHAVTASAVSGSQLRLLHETMNTRILCTRTYTTYYFLLSFVYFAFLYYWLLIAVCHSAKEGG